MTQLTHTSFEEDIKGSLKPGKLADFIILDQNLFDIPLETIRKVKILATYVGGKKIFAQNK
ncbi:MAG: amidohydrolase family protein [Bacteroidetes bacterium]|nr:amidohydrolase family protein [Bacteroidota bacterium]